MPTNARTTETPLPALPSAPPSFEDTCAKVRLRTWRPGTEVRIRVETPSVDGRMQAAWDVHCDGEQAIVISGWAARPSLFWNLLDVNEGGPFRNVIGRAMSRWLRDLPGVGADNDDALQAFEAELGRCLEAAVLLLDPAVRAKAMRLDGDLRVSAYRMLKTDADGRIAQLMEVAPGAFLLVAGLLGSVEPAAAAARGFCARIKAGAELHSELLSLLEALYAPAVPLALAASELGSDSVVRWMLKQHSAVTRSAPVRRAALLRHRLMLRRAPLGIDSAGWLAVPPEVFIPEDVPEPVEERTRWYDIFFDAIHASRNIADDGARTRFLSFASREALRLNGGKTCPGERRALLETLTRCIDDREMEVTRHTSASKVLDLLADREAKMRAEEEARESGPINAPLPGFHRKGVAVLPLSCGEDFRKESEAMEHCVRDLLLSARSGTALYFAVELPFSRLTVELSKDEEDGSWCLSQVKGFRNREASLEELARLAPWLEFAARELSKG